MKSVLITLIKAYQWTFGLLFSRVCRFEPTCSSYAIEALEKFGLWRGGLLGVKRILRCHPFCTGGFDPVPEKLKGRCQDE